METERRTLGSLLRSGREGGSGQQAQVTNINPAITRGFKTTYLTIFAINLAHRFPEVSNIDDLDYSEVRSLAEFSLVTARVALEVWDENVVEEPRGKRRDRNM